MADELNFQLPPKGFDSYTVGILPFDQGILAGAFSISMQQIRNIQSVDLQQFAQVAYSIENMAGLPFTAGTDIPTDLALATFAKSQTALGSGVYGTFTNSNFFGCMSGLPYPLKAIYEGIKQLETDNLKTIYQNLYLAVTWEQATATWDGSTFTYTNRGGGYGRESGPPNATVGGNPATVIIGTDPDDLDTFGKIVSITYTGPSGAVVIDAPPGPGWPNMNTVITDYVDDANNEILAIKNANASNFRAANILDTNWNITGTALKQEQRARYNFAPPVPIPYDRWLTVAPVSLYVFVDSIPDLSKKTLPHMAAQTLEHISNIRNTGGESVIGMMRQERNQDRLSRIGIELDNNIPDNLSEQQQQILITNGTLPGAVDGVNGFTLPAWPATETVIAGNPCDDDVATAPGEPEPVAVFDPNSQILLAIEETTEGNISAILDNNCLGPFGDLTGPIITGTSELPPGLPSPQSACGDVALFEYTPCTDNNGLIPTVIVNPVVPVGELVPLEPEPEGINLQPPVSILPINLDTAYTGTTLIPSTYNVPEAIDKVIECNCDCWVN